MLSLYNELMTQDELHDALDALVTTTNRPLVRVVGHALIALGLMTKLECAYEECILPTREFSPHDGTLRWDKAGPTVDHVIELWDGGTDRPKNLRLVHSACNTSKSIKIRLSRNSAWTDKMRQAAAARWQDPEFRKKRAAAMQPDEVRARISQGVKNIPSKPCPTCGKMFKPAGLGVHRKTCKGIGV